MTILWKKLYKAVDSYRKTKDLSWRSLATEYGLTASVFTRISQGKPLSAVNLMKVFWLLPAKDLEIRNFVKFD